MDELNEFIIVYITNPSKQEAKRIAKHLLKKKLIACANIILSNSIYYWNNSLQDEDEYILIAKTLEQKYNQLVKEVKKIHPYEVPCIIKIPVASNREYFEWLINTLS